MPVSTSTARISTRGHNDIHDLTPAVRDAISASGLAGGLACIFVPGSTAGITTIEFEPGVIADLKDAIERLAPAAIPYRHDERWGDGNGYSHVRAALLGPSLTVPFSDGEPLCGTWQQIILVDCDNRPRTREVIIRCVGE